jgi:hypothetical protein
MVENVAGWSKLPYAPSRETLSQATRRGKHWGNGWMIEPTFIQLQNLYRQSHFLTNSTFQPIHIIRMDERTGNIYVLAGQEESIEFQIDLTGELVP